MSDDKLDDFYDEDYDDSCECDVCNPNPAASTDKTPTPAPTPKRRLQWPWVSRKKLETAYHLMDLSKRVFSEKSDEQDKKIAAMRLSHAQEIDRLTKHHAAEIEEVTKNARALIAKHVSVVRSRTADGYFNITTSVARELMINNDYREMLFLSREIGRHVEHEISRSKFYDLPNRSSRPQASFDPSFYRPEPFA